MALPHVEFIALIKRIRGRRDMHQHTAEVHPDPNVRIRAAAKAEVLDLIVDELSAIPS